jgi:hypothetical protein
VLAVAWLHGCATGSETELGGLDEDAGPSVRLDAGGTPDPAKTDAAVPPKDAGPKEDASTGDGCTAALAAIAFSFDADAQGWTHGISDGVTTLDASWPFDGWTRGTAGGTAPTPACKSGACFGSELTQNYAQCQRSYLMSPPIDLSKCSGKTIGLVFQHAYAFWSGTYNAQNWFDGGVVEVSTDGQTWSVPPAPGIYSTELVKINPDRTASYQCVTKPFGVTGKAGFTGKNPTMSRVSITLPASAISATTRIRFSMASGVSSQTTNADTSRSATDFGWRIDDVGFEVK